MARWVLLYIVVTCLAAFPVAWWLRARRRAYPRMPLTGDRLLTFHARARSLTSDRRRELDNFISSLGPEIGEGQFEAVELFLRVLTREQALAQQRAEA